MYIHANYVLLILKRLYHWFALDYGSFEPTHGVIFESECMCKYYHRHSPQHLHIVPLVCKFSIRKVVGFYSNIFPCSLPTVS